jgi:hypothetical protein
MGEGSTTPCKLKLQRFTNKGGVTPLGGVRVEVGKWVKGY